MKVGSTIALANWILEHTAGVPYQESLLGDLTEELQTGRSVGWYWRQVLSAVAIGVSSTARGYRLPLVFSVGWGVVYAMGWPPILNSGLTRTLLGWMAIRDWPYSSAFGALGVVLPAILFVWIGFFVYLASCSRYRASRISILRTVVSLSISLNVLLIGTLGLRAVYALMEWRTIGQPSYLVSGLPMAACLFAGLVYALAQRHQRRGWFAG